MSTLLEQASLVMIPSGYKEDVVYSQIPTDGSGDLAFTRASNGTRINSAGLVEVCPWNLMPWSETFNLATGGWTLQGGAITVANSGTAPNGTNTATLLYPSVNGVIVAPNRRAEPTTAPSTAIYTQYVYAKASGKNWLALFQFNGSSGDAAWFNLSTGVVGTVASGCTAFIESAGNGWYKCGFSQSVTSGQSLYMHIYPTDADNTNAVTASGTNGILIWGAQLNIGATAKPYFPTTDRLNVPRLTYQNGGGGCPSLLLEKQSTNNVLYSEDFSQADWTKTSAGTGSAPVVTTNYATSPDGTQNADLVVFDRGSGNTSSDFSWLYQSFVTASATYTMTCYVKAATSGDVGKNLSWRNFGTGLAWSVNLTNEWQRISVQETGTGSSSEVGFYNRGTYSTGNSVSVLMWGFQAEQSSYETSYIPTTSSSATRVADACFKTGISSLIGQTEGVLFADVDFKANTGEVGIIMEITSGAGSQRVLIYYSSTTILCYANTGVFSYSQTTSERLKIAFAYKSGDSALYVNGIQKAVSSASLSYSSLSQLNIGSNFTNDQPTNSPTNQAVLFKTRLTNAELASLTTI